MFNNIMAREKPQKAEEEKIINNQERQRTLLEKLGFAQLMFEFYTAPC
jgi:hypothetical protein